MGDRELEALFSADGLVHTAYINRGAVIHGRRDLWSDDTYRDAHICLTWTAEECTGDVRCFRREKMKQDDAPELNDVLLDDLIYADEVCEDGAWYDVPDEV